MGRIHGVGDGQCLRESPVDSRPCTQAHLKLVGDLARKDADLGTFVTRGALVGIHKSWFPAHRHLEIADIALDVYHLAVGQHLHVGMGHGPSHLGDDQRAGVLHAGEGLVELCHAPAETRLALYQVDLIARVGDVQRCLQPGDAAADDQCRGRDVHLTLCQRFQQGSLGNGASDQLLGLLRAHFSIRVDP